MKFPEARLVIWGRTVIWLEADYIRERLTQLRIKKGVSEYQMSLELGHSRSYIQGIASGRSLPSIREFLQICDYLGVTPQEFFQEEYSTEPIPVQKVREGLKELNEKDLEALLILIDRLKPNKEIF